MKKLVCLILSILVLFGCVSCGVWEDLSKTFIVSHTSPEGHYVLSLYQIGSPQWSFGSVDAKLVLCRNDGTEINAISLSFANDGGGVHADNVVDVVWLESEVQVELRHFDTAQHNFYVIPYGGQEISSSTTFVEPERSDAAEEMAEMVLNGVLDGAISFTFTDTFGNVSEELLGDFQFDLPYQASYVFVVQYYAFSDRDSDGEDELLIQDARLQCLLTLDYYDGGVWGMIDDRYNLQDYQDLNWIEITE